MKQLLVTVLCAGAGFWLGARQAIPFWLIIVLAVLGLGLWALAEFVGPRNTDGEGKP